MLSYVLSHHMGDMYFDRTTLQFESNGEENWKRAFKEELDSIASNKT